MVDRMNVTHLWRSLVFSALIVSCGSPAFCDDCNPLFSCQTNRAGKFIMICATELQAGSKWSNVQYRYGMEGKAPEFVFPARPSKGVPPLFFSHVTRGDDYRISIRFENKGYTYRIFSTTGGDGAGVRVTDRQGRVISVSRCIERPYMFPDYLRSALACDLKNPHGGAACKNDPYVEAP